MHVVDLIALTILAISLMGIVHCVVESVSRPVVCPHCKERNNFLKRHGVYRCRKCDKTF